MGFWDTVTSAVSNSKLDRLCRELGWSIDVRKGYGIGLFFNGDRVTPQRTVYVIQSGNGALMSFACNCRAEFSDHNLPGDLMPALLLRNEDVTMAAWQASLDGRTISLSLQYTALSGAVDAPMFKAICATMVEEVAKVEAHLHGKGLI